VLVAGLAAATVLAGCGQADFTRRPPRPPATVQITGVITPQEVEVSPDRLGAGPVILIISNQAPASHTVILEGERLREQVGPINPQDTATIQANLQQGRYTVRAGSERAVSPAHDIRPAVLTVGRERPTGEDELLRP
jgi:hypothetical protein